MDYIRRRLDGKFEVGVSCQDGTERFDCDTREEAEDFYRSTFRFLNGLKGDDYPVKTPAVVDELEWPMIVVGNSGKVVVNNEEFHRAAALAIHLAGVLQAGQMYQMRVVFEAVGQPTFIGSGI